MDMVYTQRVTLTQRNTGSIARGASSSVIKLNGHTHAGTQSAEDGYAAVPRIAIAQRAAVCLLRALRAG